jgi:hypothetical protein
MGTYLVVDRTHFFRKLITSSNSKDSSDPLTGFIFPSPSKGTSLKIYELRFGSNGHLSYILTAYGLAWIDKGEFIFLRKWLTEYMEDTYLRLQANATFEYSHYSTLAPLWVSGGMSRGPHMFHYGHFATDYLPAIRFIKDSHSAFTFNPIISKSCVWHNSLTSVAGLTSEFEHALPLKEPLEVTHYPHITCHSLDCSIFLTSPVMDLSQARRALIYNSLRSIRSPDFFSNAIKPNTVFLSRRKTNNPRIYNEDSLCNSLAMLLPRFVRIDPEEYDINELLRWLNGTGAVIISAASSSLDPIMQYGTRDLRFIVLYSLSIKDVLNDNDVYSIYARNHGYHLVQRVYVKPLSSSGPSWDDPIVVDPTKLAQLVSVMQDQSPCSLTPCQFW